MASKENNEVENETSGDAKAKRRAFQSSKFSKTSKSMDFDALLPYVGEFGRYQQLLVFLICLPACIPCGFHAFNQLFMSPTPPHWCRVAQFEQTNLTAEQVRNLSIPYDYVTGSFSQCLMYNVNFSEILSTGDLQTNSSWPTKSCTNGWTFDTSRIHSSIVIDYELVCDRAIYPTLGLSVLNIGGIFGVYIFGVVSDKYGRRVSFLACLAVEQVFGLATAFAPQFWSWLACRFMVGLTIPAIYQIPFIISLELVGPNYRSFVTVMTCLFYVGGMLLLSLVAYFVRNWVHLCMATSLPFFTYIIFWWVLPESPRWLLAQGKLKEANAVLEKMAKMNGSDLPESFVQKLQSQMIAQQAVSQCSSGHKEVGFLSLWRTPNMRIKTLLITFIWIANETVYVGLSYYGPALGDNEYMSFFLSSIVEVPSYLLCWIIMDRWGRRWILGLGMIIGGVFSIITVLMPPGASMETLVLYLVAKFAESSAFLIIYPFGAELYPTEVRGVGIGFSAYMGGLGLVAIPFINYLGTEMLVLPLLIMGILSVVGGVTAFRLPETLQQKLPNTMEEGEEFGKEFSWKDCWSCIPETHKRDSLIDELSSSEELRDIAALNFVGDAGHPKDSLSEATPLRRIGSSKNPTRRSRLTKQASVVTDSSGVMKMTLWA